MLVSSAYGLRFCFDRPLSLLSDVLPVGKLANQLQPHRYHGAAFEGGNRRAADGERQGYAAKAEHRGSDRRPPKKHRQVHIAHLTLRLQKFSFSFFLFLVLVVDGCW